MSQYVKITRIEFIVTNRCNSRCRHCLIDIEKRNLKPTAISIELSTRVIKEIASKYSPQSIMTFGGEPLLFPEVVCSIHQTARDCGIGKREIITNAGWKHSEIESRIMAKKLAESGVTDMAISVDGFHQEYIPVHIVEQNVRMLVDVGISVAWNPCWVISKEHDNTWNTRTKAILGDLRHLSVPELDGNIVQPAGNALKMLSEFLPEKTLSPEGSCEDVPYAGRLDQIDCISIEPNGDVAVCKQFYIGNAAKQNTIDILQNYNPHAIPEMEAIFQGGMATLEEYAMQKGVTPSSEGYFSICDKCIDLRQKIREISADITTRRQDDT
jgi:hypothetical protein